MRLACVYGLPASLDELRAAGEGWTRTVRDQRLDAPGIGDPPFVPGSRPGDLTVVLDADQEPSGLIAGTVRQTDNCLDEGPVVQGRRSFTLEFDVESLSSGDQIGEFFGRHRMSILALPVSPLGRFHPGARMIGQEHAS